MIRVLIVDPIRLMCNVIADVLKKESDMQVVAHATGTHDALEAAANCDVAVLSHSLPDHGALYLTRDLAREQPSVKVIIIGLVESDAAIMRYIEAGALGYVLQRDSVDELLRIIRAVHAKQALIPPSLAALLMSRVAELSHMSRHARSPMTGVGDSPLPDLTRRERQVLGLIAQGYCNLEIAKHLAIEVGTAKNHVHNILDKLNVTSRKDAAAFLSLFENG